MGKKTFDVLRIKRRIRELHAELAELDAHYWDLDAGQRTRRKAIPWQIRALEDRLDKVKRQRYDIRPPSLLS